VLCCAVLCCILVAAGSLPWKALMAEFWGPLEQAVTAANKVSTTQASGKRKGSCWAYCTSPRSLRYSTGSCQWALQDTHNLRDLDVRLWLPDSGAGNILNMLLTITYVLFMLNLLLPVARKGPQLAAGPTPPS